jgi:hypothetical protein
VPWWEIQGTRQDGDLLVRFNLISGSLTSVELAVWHEGGYLIFDSDTQGLGQGCTEHFSYAYCIGAPPIDRSGQEMEVWDEEYLPVAPTLPNSFVELALDMTRLMESGTEFSSIVFRTPEDVALSSFAGIGARARSSFGGL